MKVILFLTLIAITIADTPGAPTARVKLNDEKFDKLVQEAR